MRVKFLRTIEEKNDTTITPFVKGSVVHLSQEQAERYLKADPPIVEPAPDVPLGKVALSLTILEKRAESVIVGASASPSVNGEAIAHVRLVNSVGSSLVATPAPKFAPIGAKWEFTRPKGEFDGSVILDAQLHGYEPSAPVTLTIPRRDADVGSASTESDSGRKSRRSSQQEG